MENLVHIAMGLLALSAVVHLAIPFIYTASKDIILIGVFGIIYGLIAVLVFNNIQWGLYLGIGLPLIGLIGAAASLKTTPVSRKLMIPLMLIDAFVAPVFLISVLSSFGV